MEAVGLTRRGVEGERRGDGKAGEEREEFLHVLSTCPQGVDPVLIRPSIHLHPSFRTQKLLQFVLLTAHKSRRKLQSSNLSAPTLVT